MGATVNLLGSPTIITDGRPLELPPGKTSALLYYLAHQCAWVPREDLLFLFWPDKEETKGRSNLRQLLTTVRRHASLEGVEIERSRVRWQLPTDLHAFRSAIANEQPDQAVKCYAGPLLEGFRVPDAPEFESWLELERGTLHQHWRNATLQYTARLREARRGDEAVGLLEHLVKTDPLDEQAFRALLRTLAGSGRRADALARYTSFKERLREDLGVEPEAETRQLVRALREEAPTPAPPGTQPQPGRPATRQQLPRPPTGFIGRERELNLLRDYLQQPDGRLVTLLAQGGMGKTRLALETAHRLGTTFGDGAHYIPLANTPTIEGVAPTMAETLGIDLASGQEPLPQVLAALREWEALLVLDNLEHLPAMNEIVRELLAAAPGLRVLATSRARLNLSNEHVIELTGLTYPTGPDSEQLETFEAVNLFASRARRLDPTFDFTRHAHDVTRICNLTAGMPLALEFASAWLRVLPIADVVTELERGLDLLEATETDVDERHGSIRQVFRTSWELLSGREREALLRLSVFQGGFTREAAKEAADVGLPLLLALRNRSFLEMDAAGRFAQHPLVEVFVRERAEAGGVDLEPTRRRHAEYLFALLERLEPLLNHPAGRDKAVAEVVRERGNVRAAWRWAAHVGRDDLFARGGRVFDISFSATGYDDELRELTEIGLARLSEGSRGWAKLVLILCLSRFDYPQWHEESYGLLDRVLVAYQHHGDEQGMAETLKVKGIFAAILDHLDEALALWRQARTLYARLGDQAQEGIMLVNQASFALDPVETDHLFNEAHALHQHTWAWREKQLLVRAHSAHVLETYGRYDQVRALLRQALSNAGHSDVYDRSSNLLRSSEAALNQGDLVGAIEQARAALEVIEPFSTPRAEKHCRRAWIRLAWVALAKGDMQGAAEAAERTDDTVLHVRIALRRGNHERARQLLFEGGLDRLWPTEMAPRPRAWQQTTVLLLATEVAVTSGHPDEAWKHLREALTLACDLVFVPSALEAFVVAAPLLPSDEAEELLALAATHPAASFDSRQRARNLMTADPTGMNPSVLTSEEILERARPLLKS